MNITAMLREGSLQDHEWWADGMVKSGEVTFDPATYNGGSKNPNNVKPDAQDQWGYGDISPIFEDGFSGMVKRNLPDDATADAGQVVFFARDLMNRGASSSVVAGEIRSRFSKEAIHASAEELRRLFAMDGIIGRIAVDSRGYESCKHAMSVTANSPFKRYLKYVIGCQCGDPQMIPVETEDQQIVASTGNAADDFLADDKEYVPKMVAHCRSTGMPFIKASDELDEQWSSDVMIDLMDLSGLSYEAMARIREMDIKPMEKVKKAFKTIDASKDIESRNRYSEAVNASEHILRVADNEIELFAPSVPDIEIDATPGDNIGGEFPELLQESPSVDMAHQHDDIFSGCDEIELEEEFVPEKDIDIDMDSEMSW